jgi:SanA protein
VLRRIIYLFRKFGFRAFLIAIWLLFSALYISNYLVVQVAENKTFSSIDDIPYNRVGVVLGTSKYTIKNGHNLYFDYRIQAAADLFKAGKIDYIIVSGDNQHEDYNEPQQMLEDLIKLGIPADKVFLDFAGLRTLDSIIRAYKIFGQKKYTVISQKFHNERAIYIAEKHGLDVIGFNAKDVNKSYGFKTNLREKMARVKVILDICFRTEPKFLGEAVLIE